MHRLRSTWFALIGGAILVTLSVSAAFGSAPSSSADGTRGQTIAGFVHGLLFDGGTLTDGEGSETCDFDEESEESESGASAEESPECEADDNDCDVEEPTADAPAGSFGAVLESEDCEADDDGTDEEQAEEDEDASDGTHGACVREVAHDKDAVGGKNDNHGGAVSEAARETCREDESEASDDDGDVKSAESEAKAAEKEARKAERAEAKAAEKEARKAEKEARKADGAEARDGKGHGHDDGDEDEDEDEGSDDD